MRLNLASRLTIAALALSIAVCAPSPVPASANVLKPICGATKLASGLAGRACSALSSPGKLLGTAKKLLTGHIGGAVKSFLGEGAAPAGSVALGLAAIGTWVIVGAKAAMSGIAKALGQAPRPLLTATWFSATYWRMAGIASLLTLPFLCAAAVQAVLRSDLSLLARAAFGYLPLAMLAVGIAAPLTMLLLAASDQMSAIVSSAAGDNGTRFLAQAGAAVGFLSVFDGSPFLAFLVGLLAAAAAILLWLELLARQAAVYVVVLMLPLAFAAMVWPTRRVWAIRAVELLFALILAKFVIVAVLSLGAAPLGHLGSSGIAGAISGIVLVFLAAFAPWALLRLLPLSELAAGAAGPLRGEVRSALNTGHDGARPWASESSGWAKDLTARMRGQASSDTESDGLNAGGRRGAESEAGRLGELAAAGAGPGATALAVGSAAAYSAGANGASASATEHPDGAAPSSTTSDSPSGAGSAPSAGSAPGGGGAPGGGVVAGGSAPGGGGAGGPLGTEGTGERSPGMEARWEAPDQSWAPLRLGPEGGPTEPLWPAENEAESTGHDGPRHAEDHDPLPPRQDPEDGRL